MCSNCATTRATAASSMASGDISRTRSSGQDSSCTASEIFLPCPGRASLKRVHARLRRAMASEEPGSRATDRELRECALGPGSRLRRVRDTPDNIFDAVRLEQSPVNEALAHLAVKPVNVGGFGLTPVAAAPATCYAYL